MATVYKAANGLQLEKLIALHEDVQNEMERLTFEAAVRAEEDLRTHRLEGDAFIEIDHGDVDWYVILNDERGQLAALSIEYGRAPYQVEFADKTREWRDGSEGLYILHDAFRLAHQYKLPVKTRVVKIKDFKRRGGF